MRRCAVAGAVHILRGESGTGLVLTGQGYMHEGLLTDRTAPRTFELFGLALAAGQFDGRRGDDLAIGAPYERLNDDFGGDGTTTGTGRSTSSTSRRGGARPGASDVFLDVAPAGTLSATATGSDGRWPPATSTGSTTTTGDWHPGQPHRPRRRTTG